MTDFTEQMYFADDSPSVPTQPSSLQDLGNQQQNSATIFDMSAFGREDKQDVQETDNEALSSLLMLSKPNNETTSTGKVAEPEEGNINIAEYHNNRNLVAVAAKAAPTVISIQQTLASKRNNASPSTERSIRGESNQPLSKTVRIEDLRRFFHLPIVEVARQLGTCTTALKKICRKNKINKWPYRQIRSITKSIQSLEMASLNDTLNEELRIQYREQIVTLQNAIDDLIRDPNKVVTLVNMGLSEDLNKNADRTSSALHNGTMGGMGIGVGGVLNMLPWPKPSADVQQIMLAASAMTTQSAEAASLATQNKPPRAPKRKLANNSEQTADSGNYTDCGKKDGSSSVAIAAAPAADNLTYVADSSVHNSGSSSSLYGTGRVPDYDTISDGDGESDGDDMGGPDPSDNLRSKIVDIGLTQVQCDLNLESHRLQFSGPVQLAPLQRKKLRPNVTRKVVPLMEPDIGSNFNIEFIPQFILSILHKSLARGDRSLQDLENRILLDGGGSGGATATSMGLLEGGQGILPVQEQQQGGTDSVSTVGIMLSGTAPLIPVHPEGGTMGGGPQMDGGMSSAFATLGNASMGQNVFAANNFTSADFHQLSSGLNSSNSLNGPNTLNGPNNVNGQNGSNSGVNGSNGL